MDEPFSALDPLIRHQLQDELLTLQEELQKTIVFVSHDLDEALKLGSHIAIMKDGQIVQHGKPEAIVLEPANDYVKSFVASTNPLNVLAARSLALPIGQIQEDASGNRCINKRYDTWLHTPDVAGKSGGHQRWPNLPDPSLARRPRHRRPGQAAHPHRARHTLAGCRGDSIFHRPQPAGGRERPNHRRHRRPGAISRHAGQTFRRQLRRQQLHPNSHKNANRKRI